ncbi:glutamate racemase [Iodidimonas muriae]|uniref:Glutamate racemase n=1 Tax=Iodidimonas muriae TaxID=261467 RepID=A0ABQ2LD45_9PROT|nr:aspartate/glutamate racemase family protein [Iodidimonas muriae]GER07191.1 glutamate racemase [Kordiimonadales bacterium JCM 17843]GGO11583.1 glutamate racemase [Iodidimonas muriae]
MIGIFDSGSGGLTVLKALRQAFPHRDFLYFGDHARAPYGSRDAKEVAAFTQQAIEFLLDQGCRLIVIACNTAAAVALRPLQQGWLLRHAPQARVLGVHVPLVETITGQDWAIKTPASTPPHRKGRSIAIFATPRTVASRAFVLEISQRAPEITVFQQACPGLADAIEAHLPDADIQNLVDGYVAELVAQKGAAAIDSVALACTHYPFAIDQFRKALPRTVEIFTQPHMVATALEGYLARHPEMDISGSGHLRLLTSGDPKKLNGLASRLPPDLRQFIHQSLPEISA